MLFLVRIVYWVFAGAIAAKLISFLFNPRSTSLEGLISSLWSQFNTGTLYYVCVCTAAGYSRMCVAGLLFLLLLLLLPPVGGSFIDFSRSVAHTEESSAPLMSLVVIFAPLAPFLCLSHHCCCWCCHFMFINALGLDKLAPKKQFSENCLQQKVVAALSDPPSPSALIHTPLGAETAQTALRLKQNLSFTHTCTQNPPPSTAPPPPLLLFCNPHCRRPHIVIVIVIKINFISAFGHFWERLKRNSSKNEANWGTNSAVPTPRCPTARLTHTL